MSVNERTAIRWSKRPNFPVVRLSDKGSVYALPSEIDAWMTRSHPDVEAETEVPSLYETGVPDDRVGVAGHLRTRRLLIVGVAAFVAGAVGAGVIILNPAPLGTKIRAPELEVLYIDARSDLAARTQDSLTRAADKFRNIVARYPDFVPGFTGLADTYILSCEFGATDRAVAFRNARAAVSTALALSPENLDANRIMGFLTYWTTRDIAQSRPFFNKAARGDQTDYLSRLWFGNALIDAGRLSEGLGQLQQAIILGSESPSVLTDYAQALWQAGQSEGPLSRLADVEARFPMHSGAPSAAALFQLQIGNIAAYLDESHRWLSLIANEQQAARLTAEAASFTAGGAQATLALIARSTPIVSSFTHGGELPIAIAASMIGDRERVRTILRGVADRGDNWRSLRFPAESFLRWKEDVEMRSTAATRARSIEFSGLSEALTPPRRARSGVACAYIC